MKKLLAALLASAAALAGPGHRPGQDQGIPHRHPRRRERPGPPASNECVRDLHRGSCSASEKVFPPADYDGVIQGLLGGTLDIAGLGASAYAKVYLTNPERSTPILVKTNSTARPATTRSVARKDSGITTLADMKGKKLGFADPNSTSGYLIPSVEIPQGNRRDDGQRRLLRRGRLHRRP